MKKQLPRSRRERRTLISANGARRVLDDHMKLAQQGWTEAEKVKRRLQREFLTVAEFELMSTITHNTGGFEVRSTADAAVALKQTTACRTATR